MGEALDEPSSFKGDDFRIGCRFERYKSFGMFTGKEWEGFVGGGLGLGERFPKVNDAGALQRHSLHFAGLGR